MRGRLIFPMTAVVATLDTEATEAAGGYDDVMQEVVYTDTDDDGIGETLRQEDGPDYTTFPAQVENDKDEMQRMVASGDVPDSAVVLIVHHKDMARLGMLDPSRPGGITLQKGDRLVSLSDRGGLVRTFPDEAHGGYFCTHVKLADGFVGHRANLTYLAFSERPQGLTR